MSVGDGPNLGRLTVEIVRMQKRLRSKPQGYLSDLGLAELHEEAAILLGDLAGALGKNDREMMRLRTAAFSRRR
jgi:hypothetical protein